MDEKIHQILQDLYNLDPHFRQHEDQLVRIIVKLLESKPDTKFDAQFAENLRFKLLQSSSMPVPRPVRDEIISIKHQFVRRLSFAAGLVAVFLVIAATTLYVNRENGNKLSIFSPGVKITSAGEGAFGELAAVSTQEAAEAQDKAAVPSEIVTKPEAPMVTLPSPLYPPYEYVSYKYVYKGEPLSLTESKREVLKRLKGNAVVADFDGLLQTLNLGLVNLGSFNSPKLQSATFVEDGDGGYVITADALIGAIYISAQWPKSYADCRPGQEIACLPLPPEPLRVGDIPDDNVLISIANEFVSKHNIPLTAYGQPEVIADWKIYLEKSAPQETMYVPDVIGVVYPLKLNNNFVFDESGNKTGLIVYVSVRDNKVMNLAELTTQNYQSSLYDAETDVAKILSIAERGGLGYYFGSGGGRIVEIELGTPKIELVKMWNYQNNESQELLIPSMVFPVVNAPKEMSYRRAVIVPLVKKILDNNPYGSGPTPLPGVMQRSQ